MEQCGIQRASNEELQGPGKTPTIRHFTRRASRTTDGRVRGPPDGPGPAAQGRSGGAAKQTRGHRKGWTWDISRRRVSLSKRGARSTVCATAHGALGASDLRETCDRTRGQLACRGAAYCSPPRRLASACVRKRRPAQSETCLLRARKPPPLVRERQTKKGGKVPRCDGFLLFLQKRVQPGYEH